MANSSLYTAPPGRVINGTFTRYKVISQAEWNISRSNGLYTFSNNNRTAVINAGADAWRVATSTQDLNTGKYYWEYVLLDVTPQLYIGVVGVNVDINGTLPVGAPSTTWMNHLGTLDVTTNATDSIVGAMTVAQNDIIMNALDLDTGQFWIGVNGVWHESGDPSGGTNPIATGLSTASADITPAIYTNPTTPYTIVANFDANTFSYAPPTGFGVVEGII